MKRRDSIEIMVRLLQTSISSIDRTTKSRMVYESGLNFTRCEPYIDFLTRKRLFEYVKPNSASPGFYKITPKGKEALGLLLTVKERLYGEETLERSPDLLVISASPKVVGGNSAGY